MFGWLKKPKAIKETQTNREPAAAPDQRENQVDRILVASLPHLLSKDPSHRIQAAKNVLAFGETGLNTAARYLSSADAVTQQLKVVLGIHYTEYGSQHANLLLRFPTSTEKIESWLSFLAKSQPVSNDEFLGSDGHGKGWHLHLAKEAIRLWEQRTALLSIGNRIADEWLINDIKRGGMGLVCICGHDSGSDTRALKTLLPRFICEQGPWHRFGQEIATWVRLGRHPNIVGLDSIVSPESQPWLVMEYVRPFGQVSTLHDLIQKGVSVEKALALASEVCAGMAWASSQVEDFVHRDLKPANVLIDESASAKVSDFGLSKCRTPRSEIAIADLPGDGSPSHILLTRTGDVMGTPPYMSPEQCRGSNEVDTRADIYALGCMLFELLAGRWPFIGKSAEHILQQHMTAPIPNVTDFRAGLSEVVGRVVSCCLAKEPGERYSDFTALQGALADITGKELPRTPDSGAATDGADLARFAHQITRSGFAGPGTDLFVLASGKDPSLRLDQLKFAESLLSRPSWGSQWVRPFEALGVDPGEVDDMGYRHRRTGDLAIQLLEPLIEEGFQRIKALHLVGYAYADLGKTDEAIRSWEEVTRRAGRTEIGRKSAKLIEQIRE